MATSIVPGKQLRGSILMGVTFYHLQLKLTIIAKVFGTGSGTVREDFDL